MAHLKSIWISLRERFAAVWQRIKSHNLDVLLRIWNNTYPLEDPKEHTLLEKIIISVPLLARAASLSNFVAFFRRGSKPAYLYIELYVVWWILILFVLLYTVKLLPTTIALVAAYRVVDIITYQLCILLVDSQDPKWRLASVRRSYITTMINFAEIVLAFAILYLAYGHIMYDKSGIQVTDELTAVYFSLVTMVTLGYGEFIPMDAKSRIIVIAHIATIVIFLFAIIPAFVSNMASQLGGREWKVPSKRE